jgi:hypothetical protein
MSTGPGHGKKSRRALEAVLSKYDMVYEGKTSKGHLKWIHKPSGQRFFTVSSLGDFRLIKNVERTAKAVIRIFQERRCSE